MDKKYQDLKVGERAAIVSIIAYILLSFIKLIIGFYTNSEALKADGWNNFSDIIASLAVLIGLKVSQMPPDKDHPYGHWKAETIASLIASFIMMMVGLQVIYQAIKTFINGDHVAPDLLSAYTAIGSAIFMYIVYRYNRTIAKKINSQAVNAAAKDNLSDTWVSIGTAVGIIGAQMKLPILDPIAASIVGVLICKTAWDIFREASHHLTDGFDIEEMQAYKETIMSIAGVKDVTSIKARNYGNSAVVDAVILVDHQLDIVDAHSISTKVEEKLMKEHEVLEVHVHMEPF